MNYLVSVLANFSACLLELFKLKRHIVSHLIFTEYEYTHVGWFTCKKFYVPLSEVVDHYQKKTKTDRCH